MRTGGAGGHQGASTPKAILQCTTGRPVVTPKTFLHLHQGAPTPKRSSKPHLLHYGLRFFVKVNATFVANSQRSCGRPLVLCQCAAVFRYAFSLPVHVGLAEDPLCCANSKASGTFFRCQFTLVLRKTSCAAPLRSGFPARFFVASSRRPQELLNKDKACERGEQGDTKARLHQRRFYSVLPADR